MSETTGQTHKTRVKTGGARPSDSARAQPLLRSHQFPSLSITLPAGALALYIRIEPQILFQCDRLNGQHITNIQWRNPHHQNIDIVQSYGSQYTVVLAGDHIYKMDYEKMLQQHVDSGADVTVGCIEVPRAEASGFGVMHVDAKDRIISFLEKPKA